MNRVDRLLSALQSAGIRGVCLADSPWPEDAYCWRNAVSEARAKGYSIAGQPCTKHQHRGRVLAYVALNGTKLTPSSVAVESCGGSPANGVGTTPLAPAPTALDLFPPTSPLRQGHGL